jgi:hypothetical protein
MVISERENYAVFGSVQEYGPFVEDEFNIGKKFDDTVATRLEEYWKLLAYTVAVRQFIFIFFRKSWRDSESVFPKRREKMAFKSWGLLRKKIQGLFWDSKRLQIHAAVYDDPDVEGFKLPRRWLALDKNIIFDFPSDFFEWKYPLKKETIKYTTDEHSTIDSLLEAYLSCAKHELLIFASPLDRFGFLNLLKAADRRIGRQKLFEWSLTLGDGEKAHRILQARFKPEEFGNRYERRLKIDLPDSFRRFCNSPFRDKFTEVHGQEKYEEIFKNYLKKFRENGELIDQRTEDELLSDFEQGADISKWFDFSRAEVRPGRDHKDNTLPTFEEDEGKESVFDDLLQTGNKKPRSDT